MRIFWLLLALTGIGFCVLSVYSCCAVAAKADEEMERQYREFIAKMEKDKENCFKTTEN